MVAAAIDPVKLIRIAGRFLIEIRVSPLQHRTPLQMPRLVRSTFRRPFACGHNGPFFNSDFFAYNFAALTPAIPETDRQSFYGSFTRDLCDKYLTVFADFKYTRSFFNAALAPTPFTPDPFQQLDGTGFSPTGISVPIQNAFNPFTVADTTLPPAHPSPELG